MLNFCFSCNFETLQPLPLAKGWELLYWLIQWCSITLSRFLFLMQLSNITASAFGNGQRVVILIDWLVFNYIEVLCYVMFVVKFWNITTFAFGKGWRVTVVINLMVFNCIEVLCWVSVYDIILKYHSLCLAKATGLPHWLIYWCFMITHYWKIHVSQISCEPQYCDSSGSTQ